MAWQYRAMPESGLTADQWGDEPFAKQQFSFISIFVFRNSRSIFGHYGDDQIVMISPQAVRVIALSAFLL